MQTDPIADFITQIRNANRVSRADCTTPYSRLKSDIAHILKKEGYIQDVEMDKNGGKSALKVTLKTGNPKPFRDIKRVSKPGLRRYVGAGEIPRVLGGLGVAVISTSKGIMTGQQAKKENIGGEILLYIW